MTSASYRRRRVVVGLIAFVLVAVIGVVGYAVWQVGRLGFGIQRSDILSGKPKGEDMNILLMGLDSRLDMNGKPLSPELYSALNAGDASDGGLNANVLMFLHVPGDGSGASGFSIARDDYVELAGCPDGVCKGKIKSAYGLAFDQASQKLVKQAGLSAEERHKQARDEARKAQITTVENFLDVKVNHFVEVTMVAFFEIAQVVQPVTVCVKQDTLDTYSGADFKAGTQQISAEQAVAFVRQRRDTSNPKLLFTDMDRSRRQQAFIVSLLTQLKGSSTLTNPAKVSGIVDVAKRNTAIDSGLDPLSLAKTANAMQGGNLSFYTLPVERFENVDGQDVNIVDVPKIRAMVKDLMKPPAAASPDPSPSSAAPSATPTIDGRGTTVSVINASGQAGAAKALLDGLVAKGFAAGKADNAPGRADSVIAYAAGSAAAADALSAFLGGVAVKEDASLAPKSLTVTIGSSFTAPAGMGPSAAPSAGPSGSGSASGGPAAPAPVDATGGGTTGPPPTALTELSGSGVPCVK